jgi:predicted kinase
MPRVGSDATTLIVLRGNSASGKSAAAQRIRQRHGRGAAIVGQDTIRRDVLKERDTPGAVNIGLIGLIARYALEHAYHVIVEGILASERYGDMLAELCDDHRGPSHFFYFDVSFEETVRRHATKPLASKYGEVELRDWFRPLDLLSMIAEHRIPETTSLDDAVDAIMRQSGLAFG